VPERLRAYREHFGLSRKRLAALLGINPSNIAGWETEKHKPTKKSLELIDTFLTSNDPLKDSGPEFCTLSGALENWSTNEH
jgi:transcriptional regulator with XRE-family HTH domain